MHWTVVVAIIVAAWTFLSVLGGQRARMIRDAEAELQRRREHAKVLQHALAGRIPAGSSGGTHSGGAHTSGRA